MGLFSLIGGIIGGKKQAKATDRAAQLQFQAAEKGIAEQARQFDATRADFLPYQQAGQQGLERLSALMGLGGAEQQQSEIDMLRQSPLYQSLYGSGRDAILANAAATGGLRGGNTQSSLYRMGEDTLSSVIGQQLSNYGGLVGVGTGASGAVGNFGANAVGAQNALRNQGAGALAQAQLVRGGIAAQNWQNAGGFADSIASAIAPGAGGGGGGGFNWGKFF